MNKVKEKINNAVVSPLLGFYFDSEPVAAQIPKLESITSKYFKDLCMGKTDSSVNLAKMNRELKKAGLQEVLDEMQKQVDDFINADIQ